MITEDTVKEKWADYLKQKGIAKDVVRKKRDKEREAVLEEARLEGIQQHCFLAKSKKDKQQGT